MTLPHHFPRRESLRPLFDALRSHLHCRAVSNANSKTSRIARQSADASRRADLARPGAGAFATHRLHQLPRVHSTTASKSARTMAVRPRRSSRTGSTPPTSGSAKTTTTSTSGGPFSTTPCSTAWSKTPIARISRSARPASACCKRGRSSASPWANSSRKIRRANGGFTSQRLERQRRQSRQPRPTAGTANGTTASGWDGSSISGAATVGRSKPPTPSSTPRSKTTTTYWSRCWPTSASTTSNIARSKNGSTWPAPASQLFGEMLLVPKARYEADESNRVAYDLAQANLAQAQALVARSRFRSGSRRTGSASCSA